MLQGLISGYLVVGLTIAILLRLRAPPAHLVKYLELVLLWPLIVFLAAIGKLHPDGD